ncbi:MAG: helix-turn-helix domain-containing protein [Betaproteobacteria bacterium]
MKQYNALQNSVRDTLERYLADLGDTQPNGMYDMVIECVERPILQIAMLHARDNQSKAAEMLGMTRNTLRKKLLSHKLLSEK